MAAVLTISVGLMSVTMVTNPGLPRLDKRPTLVPDLSQGTATSAQGQLKAAGLHLRGVYVVRAQATPGTVLGQHPSPGTKTKRDTSVVMAVSAGP